MALMLRETVNQSPENSQMGASTMNNPQQTSNALVLYDNEQAERNMQIQEQEINEQKMNPQELGQLIVNL